MSQMSLDDLLKSEPVLSSNEKPKKASSKASVTKNQAVKKTETSETSGFAKKPSVMDPPPKMAVSIAPINQAESPATIPAEAAAASSNSEDESEVISEEASVFSVSDLNKAIKNQLEGEFPIVWLRGEISNFKPHSSGHFYFTLKDSKAQISAVMFKGFNRHVQFKPEDGMEVMVRGKVTVYEPRGSYQIFCEVMEPVGLGALQIAFEQLKKKLQSEGLFDKTKKRPIPKLPNKVAIITSPTGAAIRDMLNVLGRRMKTLDITIFPCSVQGTSATKEIVKAIDLANQMGGFDVMIVGRGGGSIEDMWSFNEEPVARAIANSKIPTVSAVGHEIDFTIADFVADLRAPTPSAAAELISQNAQDVIDKIQAHFKNLRFSFAKKLAHDKQRVDFLGRKLVDPRRKLQDLSIRLDELEERLVGAIRRSFESKKMKSQMLEARLPLLLKNSLAKSRERFVKLASNLDSMSPLKVLDRGYSIVKNDKGQVLKSNKSVKAGDNLEILLLEGKISAKVN